MKGVPSRPRISVIGSSVLGQTLAKHGCSVWVARGASDPVLGAVGAIAFFASPVGIQLEVVPEGESSAPNQSACPRFCSFIGYAHLCSDLAPRRMSVILCLSATVSLCGRRHAPRSRSGVSAARWISRYQIRSLHVRALLHAFRLRVVLIINFLFVFDQSRWTWKSLPRGAAECLDDSAPLHRRCHCALSRCSQSRDCSGLRRSLSAAGWVLRCLCSLASHCAGCAGRRVQQFGCLH